MGRRHEQTILQRRHTDGQQTHEKNVQHHSSSGLMQVKTTSDVTSQVSKWLKSKTQETTSVGKDVEKKELS